MAAVWFSAIPSCMIFTLVARSSPPLNSSRRAMSSGICSLPRARSHHSAPVTRAVSFPVPPGGQVGGDRVGGARATAQHRVLPGGHSVGVEKALRPEQSLRQFGEGRFGKEVGDQPHGTLLEHAGRLAAGVALDPSVDRVRRTAVSPARSSARELAQPPWWSRLTRNTGRSGTTASRKPRVGIPPGNASMDQPPPVIHGISGWARHRSGSVRGRRRRCPPS